MNKELEALERLKNHTISYVGSDYKVSTDSREEQIKDLELIEKELKALEIIKEKEVNVFIFLHSGDLETYNNMVEDNRKLTQEEFDLLKEVLKCER